MGHGDRTPTHTSRDAVPASCSLNLLIFATEQHILEAMERIAEYVQGMDYATFLQDQRTLACLTLAVEGR